MTGNPTDTYYRSEDAQQILQIAMTRQAEVGELTRSQLFEIAAELNIAPADIVAAEQEWLVRQSEQTERQSFDQARQGRFKSRLVKHLIIAGFFLALKLVTGWNFWLYPIVFVAASVALAAWQTYGLSEEDYNNAFQKWRQRQRLKQSVNNIMNRWLGV